VSHEPNHDTKEKEIMSAAKKTKKKKDKRIVDVRYGADAPDGMCFQLELVLCGNPRCLKCKKLGPNHGPYWYAYKKHNGRTVSCYIGKELDEDKAGCKLAEVCKRRDGKAATRKRASRAKR